jgi:hypothetical protein
VSAAHAAATTGTPISAGWLLWAAACVALAVGGLILASVATALVRSSVRTHAGHTRHCLIEARLDGDLPWSSPQLQDLVDWFDVVARSGRVTSSGRHGIGPRVRPASSAAPETDTLVVVASERGRELLQKAVAQRALLTGRCTPLTGPWWSALLRNRLATSTLELPPLPDARHPRRTDLVPTPPPLEQLLPVPEPEPEPEPEPVCEPAPKTAPEPVAEPAPEPVPEPSALPAPPPGAPRSPRPCPGNPPRPMSSLSPTCATGSANCTGPVVPVGPQAGARADPHLAEPQS